MGKSRKKGDAHGALGSLEVAGSLVLLAVSYAYLTTHRAELAGLTGHPVKRYTEFRPFYHEHYRATEHANEINRYLHFIGTTLSLVWLLFDPRLLPAALLALGVGLNVFELTQCLPHGLLEFASLVGTFLAVGRRLSGGYRGPLRVLLCGYACAWVGHFFWEDNRPATFTYASYSLMGDMRMWYETLLALKDKALAVTA